MSSFSSSSRSQIFDLSKAEQRVFEALRSDKGQSLALVAAKTKVPRTTVVRALDALHRRGLVVPQKSGKRVLWLRATTGSIEEKLLQATRLLGLQLNGLLLPGFNLLFGVAALKEALWRGLESLPRNGRFKGVQPLNSADLSLKKVGTKEVVRINEYIKKRGIISEGVLSEQYVAVLLKKHGRAWLKSFIGRLAHTRVVPDEYLQYEAEVYLFGTKSVLLVNWKEESGVSIVNEDVVALLNAMFTFMHDSGRRVDNNAIGESLLKTLPPYPLARRQRVSK